MPSSRNLIKLRWLSRRKNSAIINSLNRKLTSLVMICGKKLWTKSSTVLLHWRTSVYRFASRVRASPIRSESHRCLSVQISWATWLIYSTSSSSIKWEMQLSWQQRWFSLSFVYHSPIPSSQLSTDPTDSAKYHSKRTSLKILGHSTQQKHFFQWRE